MRIFKAGGSYAFGCAVLGELADLDKHSSLEVQTRILNEGRVVYESAPRRVDFGQLPAGALRQVQGQLKLQPIMTPGDYVLRVTVRDLLAPAGQMRVATQFADFQVRE
jgi:hypothetical protein